MINIPTDFVICDTQFVDLAPVGPDPRHFAMNLAFWPENDGAHNNEFTAHTDAQIGGQSITQILAQAHNSGFAGDAWLQACKIVQGWDAPNPAKVMEIHFPAGVFAAQQIVPTVDQPLHLRITFSCYVDEEYNSALRFDFQTFGGLVIQETFVGPQQGVQVTPFRGIVAGVYPCTFPEGEALYTGASYDCTITDDLGTGLGVRFPYPTCHVGPSYDPLVDRQIARFVTVYSIQ